MSTPANCSVCGRVVAYDVTIPDYMPSECGTSYHMIGANQRIVCIGCVLNALDVLDLLKRVSKAVVR